MVCFLTVSALMYSRGGRRMRWLGHAASDLEDEKKRNEESNDWQRVERKALV